MKCNICDKDLSEKEVVWNDDIDTFDPCAPCLEIIYDTAFSEGFTTPDDSEGIVVLASSFDDPNEAALYNNLVYSDEKETPDDYYT